MKISFCGYQNTKYLRDAHAQSITNPDTQDKGVPESLDLTNETLVYDYSKQRIKDLYKCSGQDIYILQNGINYDKKINALIRDVSDGSVNSSNLGMILDLVRDKKLPAEILRRVIENGQISRCVSEDLDKLYEAFAEGKDVRKVFVPPFRNKKEAESNTNIGDVCEIQGYDNIFTKMPDGSIKELFITPDTYLELFPPVERFIAVQGVVGDCYLVAAYDAVNQNPNTRHKLFELFKENPDGTVDAVLGGFKRDKNNQIIPRDNTNVVMKDISNKIADNFDKDKLAFSTEATRAFEVLIELTSRKLFSRRKQLAIETGIKEYQMLQRCLQTGEIPIPDDVKKPDAIKKYKKEYEEETKNLHLSDDEIYYAGNIYKKEEIELLLSLAAKGTEIIACTDDLHDGGMGLIEPVFFNRDDIKNMLSKLENFEDDDITRFLKLYLQRMEKSIEKYGYSLLLEGLIPKEACSRIFDRNSIVEIRNPYDDGGAPSSVLDALGLKIDEDTEDIDIEHAEEILMSEEGGKNVFVCLTDDDIDDFDYNNFPIFSSHAYAIEVADTEEGRKFIVRNPHNSMYEAVFTYEELCKCFDTVTCAEI